MSETSGTEPDIPEAGVCDARTKQFATITDTDEACAHFFLQDHKWDLQKGLDAFYEQYNAESNAKEDSKANDNEDGESLRIVGEDSEKGSFRLLTWNIDGLDEKNLVTRTKAVCTIIILEKPDVVFLQEVTEETWAIVEGYLSGGYQLFSGRNGGSLLPYFTATLLRKNVFQCRKEQLLPFPTSDMGRTLLILQVEGGGEKLTLVNTHLESMREHAAERVKQTKKAFQVLADSPSACILAGDMNARDKEIDQIGGVPDRAEDVWIRLGRRKFTEFTWDCAKNDNKTFEGRFKPRCRYDRVYFSKEGVFEPTDLKFVGMDRIKNIHCFPSDHWGVMCSFQKKNSSSDHSSALSASVSTRN